MSAIVTTVCPHCGKSFDRSSDGKSLVPDSEDAGHYVVNHNADETETGMPMNRTYVRLLWRGHAAQKFALDAMLRDWCRERFGPETAYVQGVAPVPNWSIHESTREQWNAARPIKWGGYATETHRVVLGLGRKSSLGGVVAEVLYDAVA